MLTIARDEDSDEYDLVDSDDGRGFATDEGLHTLALITIGTSAPDDTKDGKDREGSWTDAFDDRRRMGSRIWTLIAEPLNSGTERLARDYLLEAFEFWKEDGIASSVEVETAIDNDLEALAFRVSVFQGEDSAPLFSHAWALTHQGLVDSSAI